MAIVVQKFGGSSLADYECMKRVREQVTQRLREGYKVVVVLSAMAGETDRLLSLAGSFSDSPDPAETDVLLATGEQTSVALFTMMLLDSGIRARSMLGFQIPLHTDRTYGGARILDIDDGNLRSQLEENDVLVVAGFQGCDFRHTLTTLGRGGSDTSAVALAAALDASFCEISTDVDGVYTTDPGICPQARKLERITYDEMLEMASMGAKVLQIRSVEFAKKYGVTLHVRSTFSDEPGTLLVQEDATMESVMVSGIAYDKDQARITLVDVYDEPGIAARVFEPLATSGIVVDMIVQNPSRDGRTDLTFTVNRSNLDRALEIIRGIEKSIGAREILHDPGVAKISVIGVGMRSHSGVAAIAFKALQGEGINILIISTSEIKISCLVEEKYAELAVRVLHEAFGLDQAHVEPVKDA
jgi:aspartate kinase